MKLLCVLWSVFCVTECVKTTELRRQRRQACPEGTYKTSSGLECCLCSKGFHLKSDCTSPLTAPTCTMCNKTYMDHPNSQKNCEVCKECEDKESMKVKQDCTPFSNTVCQCKDDHYCDKGDECKVCYSCDTCEFGIKVPCTPTNNTQCNEETTGDGTVIVVVVVALAAALAAAVAFYVRKKKLLCFKPRDTSGNDQPGSEPILGDPDLEVFLERIAGILGFKVVRSLVRRNGVLTQITIEHIMADHPQNTSEQAYQLLHAWYQKHGMEGAYRSLHENLIEMNQKSNADKVRKLISDAQRTEAQQNGPVGTNGPM